MDYFRWKRRIDVCGMLLLLLQPVFWLILADGMVQYRQENYIPVEIKYPLSEVPEDQAVLVQENWTIGIACTEHVYDVVVNKEGRWKLVNYSKIDKEKIYPKEYLYYEFYDAVLRDDRIPWQKREFGMNPVLLERALNMPDMEFKKARYSWMYYRSVYYVNIQSYCYLIDNSPERLCIDYSTGLPKKCDYTPLYIQCKMKQLGRLGDEAW